MLNQTVGYAITALSFVASTERPVLVREIAKSVGIPGPYLAKLVNTLAKKGFVYTQRGIGGGVVLAQEPAAISLFDLCKALDDPVIHEKCMLGLGFCVDTTLCPAHEFWMKHRPEQIEFLQSTTLADMANGTPIPYTGFSNNPF